MKIWSTSLQDLRQEDEQFRCCANPAYASRWHLKMKSYPSRKDINWISDGLKKQKKNSLSARFFIINIFQLNKKNIKKINDDAPIFDHFVVCDLIKSH